MIDLKLSGNHVQRILGLLYIPDYRGEIIKSFHTNDQRTWANKVVQLFDLGSLTSADIVGS